MPKVSIRDLDLRGRRVFVRVDFNVPLKDGHIGDDTRIRESVPTIQYALDRGAIVVLASHLGRPKGKPNASMSLAWLAPRLGQLLGRHVDVASDCIGEPARLAIARAKAAAGATVVLLENLRFHTEEEANDAGFAASLAELADVYVNDAFGAAHRSHASVEAIVRLVPQAGAGLLMEKELQYLGHALESPERPFVAILGGAKVSDKLDVIENLLPRVDRLLIGGAMAYTFLLARNLPVGRSLVEADKTNAARSVAQHAADRGMLFQLPLDHVVAARVEATASPDVLDVEDPAIGDRLGLDIGPKTIARFGDLIADARTVVWNGPMGVFEIDQFARGTTAVAEAVAAVSGTTIVGGGDSIAALKKAGVAGRITHISTGGGASLEFLAGRRLPGVEALPDRLPQRLRDTENS